MNKRTESSLIEALAHCAIPRLPEVDNGEDVWLKAIAKVVKSNGIEYFVCVEKDPKTLENKIVKDFGDVLSIARVIEYYPYSFLKPHFAPEFKTQNKKERIAYLVSYTGRTREELESMTLKELNKEALKVAIGLQFEHEKKR